MAWFILVYSINLVQGDMEKSVSWLPAGYGLCSLPVCIGDTPLVIEMIEGYTW